MASGFGRTGECKLDKKKTCHVLRNTNFNYLFFLTDIPVTNDQVLSKVNLTVISNEECLMTYPQVISPSNICTSGSGNVCMGDSGGPLVLTKNGDRTLVNVLLCP